MLNILITIYIFYTIFKIILNFLEIGEVKKHMHKQAIILSEKNYLHAANYKIASQKFEIISLIFELFVSIFWLSFGLKFLQKNIISDGGILENTAFVMSFFIISFIVSLPFEVYETFKKDKVFGFTTIDAKTFVFDKMKGGILFLIFGSLLIATLSFIIQNLALWWIWGFGVIMAFMIGANMLYPTFIAPLFNKFKPLEDEDLSLSIATLLNKAGLNSDGVFSIDASKRDKRLNAFFGGLGKSKRVVLFDTLLQKVNKAELLAVLGHELGHFKHKDIIKKIALVGGMMFVGFAFFGNIPNEIYTSVGLEVAPYSIIIFFILFSPILFFMLTPLLGFASRHDEYEADKYGSECESKEALANALIKLADENKSFPYSHKLNIIFYHTHPPLIERLKALGVDFSAD